MKENKNIFLEISTDSLTELFKRCPDMKADGMEIYFENKRCEQ